jgi:serine protease Do
MGAMSSWLPRLALAGLVLALPPVALAASGPSDRVASALLADLAERAIPAVVLVQVDRQRPLSPELQEVLHDLGLPRPGRTHGDGEASGSGVIVDPEGRVITNAHVVNGAVAVTLVLSEQRRLPARVVGSDPRTDVAILQIDADGPFPWLPLGDSSQVRVGDVVLAVGNPFEFQSTVTMGIISATGRRGLDEREIQDYLQTDAAVNPGSSGGPLLNLKGQVIGINTAIYAPNVDQNSGISFAIPANLVRRVVEDLDRRGRVPRSWAGLVMRTVSEVDGDSTLHGAEVVRVIPDSPAERAGLRRGDIVVEVDGEAIPSEAALKSLVLVREVGTELRFVVTRDQQRIEIPVVTGEERDVGVGLEDLPDDAVYWGGMFLAQPEDALRAHFGVGQDRGVLVVRIDSDSPAERFGLKTGDLLLEMSGRPVTSLEVLREQLSTQEPGMVLITIQRGGGRAHAVMPVP